MPYVQIRRGDGRALARSLELDTRGRIGGYPGYLAQWTTSVGSVLSILYVDDTGIYLTNDRTFRVTRLGDDIFFSPNLTVPAYFFDEGSVTYVTWYNEWANQKNTFPTFEGLIVPPVTPAATLEMLARMRIPVSLFRGVPENQKRNIPWADQGAWVGSTTSQRNLMADSGKYNRSFFRWWPTSDNYSSSFYLVRSDDQWSLAPTKSGVADYQSLGFLATPVTNANFVGDWGDGSADRWSFSQNHVMKFDTVHIGGYTYQLSKGGKRLNQAGTWDREHLNGHPVNVSSGVEFYNGNDIGLMNIDMVVLDNSATAPGVFPLTDTMVYRMGPYVRAMRSRTSDIDFYSINPGNVPENMPREAASCTLDPWTGALLSCYSENVPYTNDTGVSQCTTLGDFSNDPHCMEWAIANKGKTMEDRMKTLCSGATHQNPSICNCFLDDDSYYSTIVNKQGVRTANSVRSTNLLQCESGLCDQDGSPSSRLYYYGNRKCDHCVQVIDVAIQAGKSASGNTITLIQQCSKTDSTYTWVDLIGFLKYQGAYPSGKYTDIVVSPDESLIFLNTSTPSGKAAMQQMSVLQYLPPSPLTSHTLTQLPFLKGASPAAYTLVSEDTWKSNTSGYSSDIRSFMLIVRTLP